MLFKALVIGEKSPRVEIFDPKAHLKNYMTVKNEKLHFFIRVQTSFDVESIWDDTFETWSLRQADKYYNDLIEAFEFLCENTTVGKSAEHLRKGYLYFKVNSHLIFYVVPKTELDII